MPSARRFRQLAVLSVCGALGVGSLAGCETTQEKAAARRAESERILEARAKRQAQKKKHKQEKQRKHQKGEG
ncbi:MAG TPA: hypothetical protein VN732_07025 [Solirubrobacterales bacterium]|nr:hypothetical protein [Solirubrobacterales bacterium]